MDQNIALEALSALTGCKVKPCPAGGFPDDGYSGGGIPEMISQFNSLTTSNDQPAVQELSLNRFTSPNELTIENLISTVFIPETLQSLGSTGGSAQYFSPQNSLDSGSDDFAAPKKKFVNMEEFFSPEYNYDFRRSKDPSECFRGGEPYTRPWGWYRFALKVKDKYPEGNTWLGSPGWRDDSSPGEWPVSFHGTSIQGAIGITKGYYEPGPRAVYGPGIYSTPDIKIADKFYARTFTSETDKKTYKVVMQNRINPEMRTPHKTNIGDYWVIDIDCDASSEEVKKISTESIRPYGILIKEVK